MTVVPDITIALLASRNWPRAEWVTATAVALAESDGRSDAEGDSDVDGGSSSKNWGLWQVNEIHGHSKASLFDPAYNAAAAKGVWDKQGWRAWGVYTNGRYRRYLARAESAVGLVAAAAGGGGVGSGDGGGGGESEGGGLLPDFGITEAIGGAAGVAGDVAGNVLSALTPDGLAELIITVGTTLVLVAVGGALLVFALRAMTSPTRDKADELKSTLVGGLT